MFVGIVSPIITLDVTMPELVCPAIILNGGLSLYMRMDRYKEEYEAQKRNAKKKRILLVLIFVFVAILAAEIATLLTLTSIDRSFPRYVEHALYDEWDLSEGDMQMQTTGRITDTRFIDLELDAISEYANKSYKDDDLSRIAHEYITALKECQTAASEHDPVAEPDAFWKAFSGPYGRRLKAIYKLHNGDFHFSLNKKKYEAQSAYILAQGWLLTATDNIKFTKTGSGDTAFFDASLQNDSGLGIEYLNIDVELLDNAGKVKETSSVYIRNVESGDNMRLRFMSTSSAVNRYRIVSETCKFKEKEVETDEA